MKRFALKCVQGVAMGAIWVTTVALIAVTIGLFIRLIMWSAGL